jgi:uroporphyrin-III C-methyltransferase/precorrin-2 dehydrogenase/sirohydrochlorin ferrochelatase
VLRTVLSEVAAATAEAGFRPPAIVVVGEVVDVLRAPETSD